MVVLVGLRDVFEIVDIHCYMSEDTFPEKVNKEKGCEFVLFCLGCLFVLWVTSPNGLEYRELEEESHASPCFLATTSWTTCSTILSLSSNEISETLGQMTLSSLK